MKYPIILLLVVIIFFIVQAVNINKNEVIEPNITMEEPSILLEVEANAENVPFQYYLILEQDYIVVYYADKQTVFERTDIHSDELSESDYLRMKDGLYLKDQKELFGILQGYSS